jgi:hypothetical protein
MYDVKVAIQAHFCDLTCLIDHTSVFYHLSVTCWNFCLISMILCSGGWIVLKNKKKSHRYSEPSEQYFLKVYVWMLMTVFTSVCI